MMLALQDAVTAQSGRGAAFQGSAGGTVDDTWAGREMPVLTAVVALLSDSYMVTVSDIAERTGLGMADVARSLDALDPAYVDFRKTETGGDPRFWYVHKVTAEARRAVGQWPTAEGLVDQFVKAFNDAAEAEDDAEKHYQLRQAAGLLSGGVRDVAVTAAERIIGSSPERPDT
jgi:predicted transcriptional regulator